MRILEPCCVQDHAGIRESDMGAKDFFRIPLRDALSGTLGDRSVIS